MNKIADILEGIELLREEKTTWFTIKELCDYLGRSRPTIHRYTKANLLPYKKIGGRYYFDKKEIDRSILKKSKLNNNGSKQANNNETSEGTLGSHPET